ncbi:MAG: glycyl-radical enzyme activating protein [Clostridia bacterium]|nr:glycyl-radical enzyme activating protein [Clostridia bacterium]
MSVSGVISNISRGSLHDGVGVRTVVYFKGCPMRCKWCHNPETFEKRCDIMFAAEKCIGCGECARVCPECHVIVDGVLKFRREGCAGCGRCADACMAGALSVCGERYTAEEIFAKVMKDSHYYRESGGGVTLSGGECLTQADFAVAILEKCRSEGINTAIESAFCVPFANVQKVLPYTDHIFADLKHHDAELHKRYTGVSNDLIIDNLRKVSQLHKSMTVRIPLIPGVNDSIGDMSGFAGIIRTFGDGIKDVELLRYNYLAGAKYENFGLEYVSFSERAQSDTQTNALTAALNRALDGKCTAFCR